MKASSFQAKAVSGYWYFACELFLCQVIRVEERSQRSAKLQDWKELSIPGVSKIERVVAHFEVWSIGTFPYAKVQIKIVESATGLYTGSPNMAAKSRLDRSPDWIAGMGTSITEALETTIRNLLQSIAENQAVSEEDFAWSAPEYF